MCVLSKTRLALQAPLALLHPVLGIVVRAHPGGRRAENQWTEGICSKTRTNQDPHVRLWDHMWGRTESGLRNCEKLRRCSYHDHVLSHVSNCQLFEQCNLQRSFQVFKINESMNDFWGEHIDKQHFKMSLRLTHVYIEYIHKQTHPVQPASCLGCGKR